RAADPRGTGTKVGPPGERLAYRCCAVAPATVTHPPRPHPATNGPNHRQASITATPGAANWLQPRGVDVQLPRACNVTVGPPSRARPTEVRWALRRPDLWRRLGGPRWERRSRP